MLENNQTHNVGVPRITMAPGEGQRPLDVILDADSEELSFPIIYAGVKRPSSESNTTVVRSELRNVYRLSLQLCRPLKLGGQS